MTANTVFQVADLDFDQIKANLKDFLRNQSQFTDYDFDGSGMNILLDLLAYNTHYNAYYLNMIANEMFIDSAVIKKSVISRAKELGYTPTSRRSPIANVTLIVTPPGGNTTSVLTVPKYTQFQSEAIDGINYTFVNLSAVAVTKNVTSNTFVFSNMNLYQGEPLTAAFTVDTTNPQTRFTIPNANIDTATLIVSVQQSSSDATTTVYSLANDITQLGANTTSFFLEAIDNNQYAIYFGDGYLGKRLANGNIVLTEYLITEGQASNKANVFTSSSSIYGFSNIQVWTAGSASGGADMETTEQIKFRAPIAYTSQNRSVTLPDYQINILDTYPNVDQISVWGGEDNDPVVYGVVYISMKPKAGFVITDLEKQRIITNILSNQSVVGIKQIIVDPIYLYILVNATVYYDPTSTTLSAIAIADAIRTQILAYNTNNLGKFNAPFRVSKLSTIIDGTEASIVNSDVEIKLQKRFTPTANTPRNYTIDFGVPIHRGGLKDKLSSQPIIIINDSGGIQREAYIEEVPFSYTGITSIAVTNPGIKYSLPPIITITGDGTGATGSATIVNGRIVSIAVSTAGTDYTIANISITNDPRDNTGTGAAAVAVLSGQYGALRLFYYKTTTGEKVVMNSAFGTIDYTIGKLVLYNFNPVSIKSNPHYPAGVVAINIEPDVSTITPIKHNILLIDPTDPLSIQINMIPLSS